MPQSHGARRLDANAAGHLERFWAILLPNSERLKLGGRASVSCGATWSKLRRPWPNSRPIDVFSCLAASSSHRFLLSLQCFV